MLELKNIGKVFNEGTVNENRAITNINLKVEKGDFITIIGSNGAGKSTLFNLISGSYGPSEGAVFLHDADVTNQPEHIRARHIGRIFQNTMLGTASNMTLEDNMMICSQKGFKGLRISLNKKRREFFREKLKELDMGLEDRLKDNVGLFSGGQRQALTLLMMVLSEPDLVLLDEHTAALDPKNADLVLGLTVKFIRDFNLTSMMITHNMDHAIRYGTRLLMMDRGEIILDVKGDEKKNLTIPELVERFHSIRKRDFTNDEALLSD
ncbi:ABC transporter ATP-binding protein [Spirochaeta isovalerica]|uniref:Putative ABC transport system ATP-binding protein n=1 Tax=Spirochaeta isovalerica TaxID=150 RepID=A0A841RCH8_9SPIO|nr:ATP-binding cassette domain-containing protein [Spirochaeta isovalerica]MBB6481376.1 putative ABC transport system ATP-binding protein [Spirochaeta isovalerica]